MAEIKVTKLEAAQRQIDAAIMMLYRGDDPVAVHTVISAACRIMRDLCSKADSPNWRKLDEAIIPGKQKQAWKDFARAANFFKHADRDPDDILEGVHEEVNDHMIFISIILHDDFGQRTVPMQAHYAWMMAHYPGSFDTERMKAEQPEMFEAAFSDHEQVFGQSSRQEKLEDGQLLLREAYKMANARHG